MKPAIDFYETSVLAVKEDQLNKGFPPAEAIADASILETSSSFVVELEIPKSAVGMCAVGVNRGILSVSAKGIADMRLNLAYIARTRFNHGFLYRLFLSLGWFEDERIYITYDHRILTIHIPKKELLEEFDTEIGIS